MNSWPTRIAPFVVLLTLAACGGAETPAEPTSPPLARPVNATDDVQPLVAWIEGSPLTGTAPLTVAFQVDLEGGTAPLSTTWDFGDGETSSERNPQHVYSKPGTYAVRLDVQDSRAGEADTDWDSLEVVVSE